MGFGFLARRFGAAKTGYFVEAKRAFSQIGLLTCSGQADLTVLAPLLADFGRLAAATKTAILCDTVALFIHLDRSASPRHQISQNHCKTQGKVTLLLVVPLFLTLFFGPQTGVQGGPVDLAWSLWWVVFATLASLAPTRSL